MKLQLKFNIIVPALIATYTWAARSTRILEKEVKFRCSNFNFGISDRPDPFPLSFLYNEYRCDQETYFPLH